MLNFLMISLLALNLIGILFLLTKKTGKSDIDSQQIYFQKLLEKQQMISSEIAELKGQTEYYHDLMQEEFANWRVERKALESSLQQEAKKEKQTNLHLNDRYKEIFELHEQGLTVDEIARKLEKGVGEVTFILQLASK